MFTEEFCRAFVEELENFEQSDMPKGRPNSMNNYGVGLSSSRASVGGAFTSRLCLPRFRILSVPKCLYLSTALFGYSLLKVKGLRECE